MDRDQQVDIVGRLSVTLFPAAAIIAGTEGLTEGGIKYGFENYTVRGGSAVEHADGLLRHLLRWLNGEEEDEHGIPNLSLAQARLAILIDLKERGMLEDDRPPRMRISPMINRSRKLVRSLLDAAKSKPLRRFTQLQPNPEEDDEDDPAIQR